MTIDKNLLSIDSDDDDNNYIVFSEYLIEDTKRKKEIAVLEIEEVGVKLLKEIDRKKNLQNKEKDKHIKYIIKHSKNFEYHDLKSYDINDVRDIYRKLKEENQPIIKKFFHFLFDL